MDNPMGGERGVAPQNYGDAFPSMPPVMASGDAHTDAADQTPVSDILTSLEIALTGHSDHAPAVPPAPVAAPAAPAAPVAAPAAAVAPSQPVDQPQWASIGHRVTLHYDDVAAEVDDHDDGHVTAESLLLGDDHTKLKSVDDTGFPWNLGVVQEVAQAALVLIPSRALGGYRQEADAWLTLAKELPSSTPIEGGDAEEFCVWIEQLGTHGKAMGSPAGLKEILSMALLSIRTRAVEDVRFAATLPQKMRG